MTGFNTQAAIMAQNAATAAATLLSGSDATLAAFEEVRTAIFEGSVALASGSVADTIPAGGSGGARRSYGGAKKAESQKDHDPATLVINMGKYKGKTIEAVYADDPDYLDWLAANSNNEFLRERVQVYLAAVE